MGDRMESRLRAVLGWVGRTGEENERDWVRAVLAEAEALPVGRRRAWLLGGTWFVLRRRRPGVAQVISAWVGVFYAAMYLLVAWSSLVDDAPDMPTGAAAAMVAGAGVLGLTFLVVSIRPLVGALVAGVTLPAYAVVVMTARQVTVSSVSAVPPPPGMVALDDPFAGAGGFVLALLVLVGVPVLALLGALVPSLVPLVAGRGGADASGPGGSGAAPS